MPLNPTTTNISETKKIFNFIKNLLQNERITCSVAYKAVDAEDITPTINKHKNENILVFKETKIKGTYNTYVLSNTLQKLSEFDDYEEINNKKVNTELSKQLTNQLFQEVITSKPRYLYAFNDNIKYPPLCGNLLTNAIKTREQSAPSIVMFIIDMLFLTANDSNKVTIQYQTKQKS